MSRYFNQQEVELLAPAGNFEIFKQILHSGADAFYLGGKILNMRLHRKDFNFSNDEIVEAIQMAHELGKKVYVTVNNLLSSEDLLETEHYLRFLESAAPDAIIVQDMSIIALVQKLKLNLNIHASVMMNVHNLETIKKLRELGVTRVVTSRDIDLNTVKLFSAQTDMEFEYFVHGDMCLAHGAQCTYSGILFGNSSNRGRCMKPCRWGYKMNQGGNQYNTTFPLAVKDMYMYENIPELIPDDVDYVVDAIDTVSAKIALVEYCSAKGIKIMSSMGTGNKFDPTQFKVADIYKTKVCPLAKVMRYELKRRGVKKLKVVYSEEIPTKPKTEDVVTCKTGCVCTGESTKKCAAKRQIPGSMSFVPPVAGMIIAGEVIKDILSM